MPGIKDAVIEILNEDPTVSAWAIGGIHARRAPQLPQGSTNKRRDRYIVVRVTDSEFEHTQDAPAQFSTDRIDVSVWASSSRDADEGARNVRIALDGRSAIAAEIDVQRIFCRGIIDFEVEDASGAEQLIDECRLTFDVGYTLPT